MSQSERTFAIIKPDAVAAGISGRIISMIETSGFGIVAMKKIGMTRKQAEAFYAVHKEQKFFNGLINFMTEGPAVVMVLEREDAINKWRELMGATDPAKATEGTIRKKHAASIERNCVHGSDAPETAAVEIPFFFTTAELL
jgi:nucleoside-diphosphate kinase